MSYTDSLIIVYFFLSALLNLSSLDTSVVDNANNLIINSL